jgi:hypothetical protein
MPVAGHDEVETPGRAPAAPPPRGSTVPTSGSDLPR